MAPTCRIICGDALEDLRGMTPAVLVGETLGPFVPRLQALGWGRMWISKTPRPYEGEPWGFDNGAFRAFLAGKPFPEAAFLRRLETARAAGTPLLAVTPDIVGDGSRSLEFSCHWRDRLPDDWPWLLAVQDGMAEAEVAGALGRFAGIFLGGSKPFKATAGRWCRLGHQHGKRFHYGRAGTIRALRHARDVGADSLDSSFPLWTKERFAEFAAVWQHGSPQVRLFDGAPHEEVQRWAQGA